MTTEAIRLQVDGISLDGTLAVPARCRGVVIFSHGSGSSRHSPRNRFVAQLLHRDELGTLLLDLLSADEDRDSRARFDIDLLTRRLGQAAQFIRTRPDTRGQPVGLFGASTGAASALRVAAEQAADIGAVVSRGGRPDLAGEAALHRVRAPTLLIVGGLDREVLALNELARMQLSACTRELTIVPGATHLFEEPGTLEQVAELAGRWFLRHLCPAQADDASRMRP
jgi:putative phosphoribosyl transferase